MQHLPGNVELGFTDPRDTVKWPNGTVDLGDRTLSGVVCFDRWHSVRQAYGNVTVSVETDNQEHHSTVRAAAIKFVRDNLPKGWTVNAYLGRENYRNVAGYSAYAKRFSVVWIGI